MRINIRTHRREEIIDITEEVQKVVGAGSVNDGLCIVFCPHTTAAITINENADPDVKRDLLLALTHIVPDNIQYKHQEGNSAAHVKSAIVGNSVSAILEGGKLKLGTWQGIMLCEFDGPRERGIEIKIIGK